MASDFFFLSKTRKNVVKRLCDVIDEISNDRCKIKLNIFRRHVSIIINPYCMSTKGLKPAVKILRS